jgi:hypothetical protein
MKERHNKNGKYSAKHVRINDAKKQLDTPKKLKIN